MNDIYIYIKRNMYNLCKRFLKKNCRRGKVKFLKVELDFKSGE